MPNGIETWSQSPLYYRYTIPQQGGAGLELHLKLHPGLRPSLHMVVRPACQLTGGLGAWAMFTRYEGLYAVEGLAQALVRRQSTRRGG